MDQSANPMRNYASSGFLTSMFSEETVMLMRGRARLFVRVFCWLRARIVEQTLPSLSLSSAAAIFSGSGASTAQLDRFALIVPDELLHFLANVSQSAIGKERNEGKSLPPWRCHFHTLGLAACQQTGRTEETEWSFSGLPG